MFAVAISIPPGFVPDPRTTPPDLSQTQQIELTQWDAYRSSPAEDAEALVAACFQAAVDSWAPEVTPLAQAKLDETIAGAATRAPPGPPHAPIAARKAQGFVHGARGPLLVSCFAWCRGAHCADAVRGATLPDDFVSPPEPSFALRAVLWFVHHPRGTASALVGLAALLGAVAIATRPRPKRRRKIG
jgi:hypothetical protein